MKTLTLLSEEKLIKQVFDILVNKLGPVETSRFFSLYSHHRLDSVIRHHQWQDTLDKDTFFNEVTLNNKSSK